MRKYRVRASSVMTIGQSAEVEITTESEAVALALAQEMNSFGGLHWREDWCDQADPTDYAVIETVPLHFEPWP